MRDQTRLGLLALGAAILLGVAGDLLLRATPWGVNAPIWIALLVAAVGVLVYRARLPLLGDARCLLVLDNVETSLSWRLTRPLRAAKRLIRSRR